MLIALVPMAFVLVGLVIFLLAKTNPDIKQIGHAIMLAGLIALAMSLATHVVHIG